MAGGAEHVNVLRFRNEDQFVTGGTKHIKFWSLEADLLKERKGVFRLKAGDTPQPKSIVSLAFNEHGMAITGTTTGDILLWQGNELVKIIPSVRAT